ncbi:DUF3800 domain-containing protein [Salinibacterium sp. SWN139]|uniref:DUF3800 domain-containing protein n=1 Tax=Salinibacterium sp. SWN139 TaxID=2792055 RepID=UPI0018CF4E0E|nr:DUF3800 domain-containing protein [Salinibacterium sp. SWN139]MBH0053188.1 DUF3800 domain-containing protein [Salinibacterium sp. SWN139]
MTTYIAYIDDSGDEKYAVYTALLIPIEKWTSTLHEWLKFRRNVFETFTVPADGEIHATELLSGKGNPAPTLSYGINRDMGKRKKLLNLAVAAVGSLEHVRVLSRVVPNGKPDDCYRSLLKDMESRLTAEDSWAILVVDGNGTDGSHKKAHRALKIANRRIVEDPWHQDSKLSQLVQMADIVSFTIFQAHKLNQTRRFMWGWMPDFIHRREWPGACNCPPGAQQRP